MAEPELQAQGVALHLRAITHAHKFEGFLVPGRHAHHHVAHQGAGQAPHRLGAGGFYALGHEDLCAFMTQFDLFRQGPGQLPLGALNRQGLTVDGHRDASRRRNRLLSDPGHISTPVAGLRRPRWRHAPPRPT